MTALVSFERVFEVLDLEPMVANRTGARELLTNNPEIRFDNVSFSYPKAEEISLASLESAAKAEVVDSGEVIHNLSFTAKPGSFTAIVGPSGAGKSTISGLLPRLYDVSQGAITINGIDTVSYTHLTLPTILRV